MSLDRNNTHTPGHTSKIQQPCGCSALGRKHTLGVSVAMDEEFQLKGQCLTLNLLFVTLLT